MKGYVWKTPLVCIFFIGTILRFTNVNWDSYQAFHPDERNIAWAVTRIRFFEQLNPKFFAYGGLPIYLYRTIGEAVAAGTGDTSWIFDWGKIAVLGRYVSAILSSASILLIYVTGQIFFSRTVGLLSAFILAFSPWAIREAHFATTETMLVFFLLIILSTSYKYYKKPSPRIALSLGIFTGLAVAAKTTSVSFVLIPACAMILRIFKNKKKRIIAEAMHAVLFLVIAGGIFLCFSPYTFLDRKHYLESMRYETGVAIGKIRVPYTLQFTATKPYMYQFKTMLWQSGPAAIVGVLGLCLLAYVAIIKRKPDTILFLIFPIVYGAYAGSWYAKFSRYNVPFLPFATLGAAWLMIFPLKQLRKNTNLSIICLLADLLICLFVIAWGLANWTIYLRPQTRIEASRYLYRYVKPQEIIYTEHWNDGLPVRIPGMPNRIIRRELLTVYDPDNEKKLNYYGAVLPKASYIVLSTRRMWAVLPGLSNKYPLTSVFYTKLLAGQLGFREVSMFTSYPKLFGVEINDDRAEESVQVFDHPTVKIFQNIEHLDGEELIRRLEFRN